MSWTRVVGLLFVLTVLVSGGRLDASVLDSSYIIFHYHGSDTSSWIGYFIDGLGDINQDGFDDIAVHSFNPLGTHVFFGGDPPDTIPDLFFPGEGAAGRIDVTGDGIGDLVKSHVYGPPAAETGRIYFYRGYADSIASVPFDSLYPGIDNWGFGLRFDLAYVDSDSIGDLLTYKYRHPKGGNLFYYSGVPSLDTITDWSFEETDNSHTNRVSRGLIDYNGDSELDIVCGMLASLDTLSYVYVFQGPDFGLEPDIVIGHPIEYDDRSPDYFGDGVYNLGDVDADGWDDLGVNFSGLSLVYRGGPEADTLHDYVLEMTARFMTGAMDINGDGFSDIVCGGGWTERGTIDVYLGGPDFDVYMDDILLRSDLPPIFLHDIGYRVAGAGDFNGDGIDDLMFSCRNFAHGHPGDVFVLRGSEDIVVGVDDPQESTVPKSFELGQNYPNPFNSTTTIEFTLNHRAQVSLDIYNVLGRHVRSLIDYTYLPAGFHNIEWDGRTADNKEVGSGIYLYRLSAGTGREVKKMLLLK